MGFEIRELNENEINREIFSDFIRRQVVDKCIRKIEGRFVTVSDPFIDDWNEEEYGELIADLKNTVNTGGLVCAAFPDGKLKGFVSVEALFIGTNGQYADLSSLHVSADMRGCGLGKELFERARAWAKEKGAEKLYISSHSAVETQAFYKAMGCVEAEEYIKKHVEAEPCDNQLEFAL